MAPRLRQVAVSLLVWGAIYGVLGVLIVGGFFYWLARVLLRMEEHTGCEYPPDVWARINARSQDR